MRKTVSIAAMILSLGLAGCATNGERPDLDQRLAERGYTRGESVRDIQDYRLSGWNYLDNKHVIIHTGPSQRYLISLRSSCHELMGSEDISFSDTAGKLTRFDSLTVRDSAGSSRDCPIDSIHALNPNEG